MPIDEPIFRTRLNMLAASVRYCTGSVAKATVDSGTNTRPRPSPWTMPVEITGQLSICGEKLVIMCSEYAVSSSPVMTR